MSDWETEGWKGVESGGWELEYAVGRNRWTRAIQRVRRGADRNTLHKVILAAKGQSAFLTHEKSNPVTISTVCKGILPHYHTLVLIHTHRRVQHHT